MTTQKSELAKIFSEMADQGEKLDTIAGRFMKVVKDDKIESLDAFNELIAKAYEENGWSTTVGRPLGGVPAGTPAPMAVRQYVVAFRAAYTFELPVLTYGSIRQVMDEVAAARAEKKRLEAESAPKDPALKGVTIKQANKRTGAFIHDTIWFFTHLPEEFREEFEERIRKAMLRLESKIPKEIRKAA